jgi:hypothetical protein
LSIVDYSLYQFHETEATQPNKYQLVYQKQKQKKTLRYKLISNTQKLLGTKKRKLGFDGLDFFEPILIKQQSFTTVMSLLSRTKPNVLFDDTKFDTLG